MMSVNLPNESANSISWLDSRDESFNLTLSLISFLVSSNICFPFSVKFKLIILLSDVSGCLSTKPKSESLSKKYLRVYLRTIVAEASFSFKITLVWCCKSRTNLLLSAFSYGELLQSTRLFKWRNVHFSIHNVLGLYNYLIPTI